MTTSPGRVATAVGRVLREHRIPQHESAAALGMSQQAMSSRVRGRTPFSAEEVRTLAEYLGVPVSVLMDEPSAQVRMDAPPRLRAPASAVPA